MGICIWQTGNTGEGAWALKHLQVYLHFFLFPMWPLKLPKAQGSPNANILEWRKCWTHNLFLVTNKNYALIPYVFVFLKKGSFRVKEWTVNGGMLVTLQGEAWWVSNPRVHWIEQFLLVCVRFQPKCMCSSWLDTMSEKIFFLSTWFLAPLLH